MHFVFDLEIVIDFAYRSADFVGRIRRIAQRKDGGAWAWDRATQGTSFKGRLLYQVIARDQNRADGLDDDILQGAPDQLVITFHKACNEPGNITPLSDRFFQIFYQY